MYSISIGCEGHGIGSSCGWVQWSTLTPAMPTPAHILQELAERGWIERDGKHYCPRHNPDLTGETVHVSLNYVEIAPGVRVRWPRAQEEGDGIYIEVQRVPVFAEPGNDEPMTDAASTVEPEYETHEWAVAWPVFIGPDERDTFATEAEARERCHIYGPTAYVTRIEPVQVQVG